MTRHILTVASVVLLSLLPTSAVVSTRSAFTFSCDTCASTLFTADTPGVYPVTVAVSDGLGGMTTATVDVTVTAPPLPVNCTVSAWTIGAWEPWLPYDATQERRERMDTRTVVTLESNGGTCLDSLTLVVYEYRAIVPPPDTISPVITSLTAVQNGRSKNYTVTANITDQVGVVSVDVSLDDVFKAIMTGVPYTATVTIKTGGAHTILVRAYDAAGNVGVRSVVVK